MDEIPYTPETAELIDNLQNKIKADERKLKAEAKVTKAIAFKHRMFGLAGFVAGMGIAAGIGYAGYAYYLDQQTDIRRPTVQMAEMLGKVFAETVFQTRATGQVELTTKGAEPLRIAPGATVLLDGNGVVIPIDPDGWRKVLEVVDRFLVNHTPNQGGVTAITSLDVVKTARTPSGVDVVTRWEYAHGTGGAQALVQRCFIRPTPTGGVERMFEIARDKRSGARPREVSEAHFAEGLRFCAWSS